MSNTIVRNRMISAVWPKQKNLFHQVLLVLLGSLLIAAGAQINIPLNPVPITLQTFAVMLVGCLYGSRLGVAAVALYLFEGAMGLPVYAQWHFFLATLFGPTGGYLWGFLPAVFLSGFLLERGWAKHIITAGLAALLGDACILFLGVLMLANFIGLSPAVQFGLLPFVLVEIVKLLILAVIIPHCWKIKRVLRCTFGIYN